MEQRGALAASLLKRPPSVFLARRQIFSSSNEKQSMEPGDAHTLPVAPVALQP